MDEGRDMDVDGVEPPAPPADEDDFEPVFLAPGEGEEVQVDESAPPMDEEEGEGEDEDDDDMKDATDADAAPAAGGDGATEDDNEEGQRVTPALEVTCHRGPVYALSLAARPALPGQGQQDEGCFDMAIGGGDDVAQVRSFARGKRAKIFPLLV